MLEPLARQILIVDAPTVLGWQRWKYSKLLDDRCSTRLLRERVEAAITAKAIGYPGGAVFLTVLINGALNGVALRVGSQGALGDWRGPLRQWFGQMRTSSGVSSE